MCSTTSCSATSWQQQNFLGKNEVMHDDVIKWEHFPRYWPFVRGIRQSQRPKTRSFDIFVNLRLNKPLSKQSRGLWLETPSRSLWRECNVTINPKSFSWQFIEFLLLPRLTPKTHLKLTWQGKNNLACFFFFGRNSSPVTASDGVSFMSANRTELLSL